MQLKRVTIGGPREDQSWRGIPGIERRDGSVRMCARCGAGAIHESVSADRGRTWSEGHLTTVTDPGSRFSIRALASGRWLHINSPGPGARTSLAAMLWDDEGETWGPPLVLDERAEVSYPDACQSADGTIYAVHDRERHGAMEVPAVGLQRGGCACGLAGQARQGGAAADRGRDDLSGIAHYSLCGQGGR